ncbi:MAG: hypothetical protein BroJett022_11200 [Actinomycetes bacterium]|nr:MAG: hypothetical protein BroJett022_11200 [Actinomycetes bacterium]
MAGLTVTDLLAAASETLESSGYARVALDGRELEGGRLYEDPYGVVAINVYDSWATLAGEWTEAQAELVELMSEHLSSADAKAWEGYLVLLTPGHADPGADADQLESIRYDTSRVRKLIAAGDELTRLADVERVLLPLLPIDGGVTDVDQERSVLDLLPTLIRSEDVDQGAVGAVVAAFQEHEPLLEALEAWRQSE